MCFWQARDTIEVPIEEEGSERMRKDQSVEPIEQPFPVSDKLVLGEGILKRFLRDLDKNPIKDRDGMMSRLQSLVNKPNQH